MLTLVNLHLAVIILKQYINVSLVYIFVKHASALS